LKRHEAAVIDPYVLFSLGDDGVARDYNAYRAANHTKPEEYMDKIRHAARAGREMTGSLHKSGLIIRGSSEAAQNAN
jgi:hypothetical protein